MKRCILILLTLPFPGQYAPAATLQCAGFDVSKLTHKVYVSPEGNDSENCGSEPGSPCKTIHQGIKNCKGEGCAVLARYGTYGPSSPIELADGISVYGSCISENDDRKYRSTILGRPAIRANNINKPTTLHGFLVIGESTSSPGDASIAIAISNSKGLTLSHDVFMSGRGGNGSTGGPGGVGSSGGSGDSPVDYRGGAGGRACPANPPNGTSGDGGQGADWQHLFSNCLFGSCDCTNTNPSDSVGRNGKDSGEVRGGGGGGRGTSGCRCVGAKNGGSDGGTGGNGLPGACAAAGGKASSGDKGAFKGDVWVPSRGGSGAIGQVGSGGGGGGSGGMGVYAATFEKTVDYSGKPGGGGGGGGCGGGGGAGGFQGGASIPLVLFNSSVALLKTNAFVPGPGGQGGTGGSGGSGGSGGPGRKGAQGRERQISGTCNGKVPGSGGEGGNGGRGGSGSGGAGGNGGPSFGIALVNSPALSEAGVAIYPAQPGAGGGRGSGGQNESSQCKAADGELGLRGFADDKNSIVSFSSAGST